MKIFQLIICTLSVLCSTCVQASSSVESSTASIEQGSGPIIELTLNGPINPVSYDYVKKGISHAREKNARLLLLKMNTPGGLLPSMQSIVESILDSPVPVVVYVTPSGGGAISAGVFITLAAHVAAMSPGTTIGAAAPVQAGGADVGEDMKGKVQNFAASMVKAIAEQRGRNVEWAEKAVRESVALTDREALDQNVIDIIAPSVDALMKQIEGRTVILPQGTLTLSGLSSHSREAFDMTTQQKIINAISDPNIAALLGLGAVGGILAEFYNPGLIIPGLIGIVCLILTLVAVQVIPISAGGVLLLLLGAALMTLEFFIPSFGIFGIAGIVCLVLGSIYAIDTSLVWSVDGFSFDPVMVGSVAGLLGVFLLLIVFFAVSSKSKKFVSGKEGLEGMTARVTRDFTEQGSGIPPRGSVRVMGEIWTAVLVEGELPVVKDSEVFVREVDGMTLKVSKV
jgi:membrane-bound serine protease (ClpP class)